MNYKWKTTLPARQHKNKSADFEVDGRVWRIVLANYDGGYLSLEYRGTSLVPIHTVVEFNINNEVFGFRYEYSRMDSYFGRYLFMNDVHTSEMDNDGSAGKSVMNTAEASTVFQSANQIDSDIVIGVSINMISDYDSRRETGYVGIRNLGATCYINSLFQVLFNINAFYNRTMRYKTSERINEDEIEENADSEKKDKKMNKYNLKGLQQIFYQLTTSRTEINPELILKNMTLIGPIDQHQDFHEYCKRVLDELETETDKDYFNCIFDGEMVQYVHGSCGCKNERTETFSDLQLDLHPNINEAIRTYFEEYVLCDENKYHCEKHGLVDAVKGHRIGRLPPVLFILIKRFSMDWYSNEVRKNNGYCEFYDTLEIGGALLKLKAVVVHSGVSTDGHYYCYVKNGEEGWLKFNDHIVTKVDEREVMEHNRGGTHPYKRAELPFSAYGLFYMTSSFGKEDDASSICNVDKIDLSNEIVAQIKKNELRSYKCNIIIRESVKGYSGPGFYNLTHDYPRTQYYSMTNASFKDINVEKKYHYVFEIRGDDLLTRVQWRDNILLFSYFTNARYDFVNEHSIVFVKKMDRQENIENDYNNAMRIIDVVVLKKNEDIVHAIKSTFCDCDVYIESEPCDRIKNGTIAVICRNKDDVARHIRYLREGRCVNFVNRNKSFTLFLRRDLYFKDICDVVQDYLMDQKVAITYFKEQLDDLRIGQIPFYTESNKKLIYFGKGCLDYNRIRHIHVLSVDNDLTVHKFKIKYQPDCISDLTDYYVVECVINTTEIYILSDNDVVGERDGILILENRQTKYFRACHAVLEDSMYKVTGFPFLFFYDDEKTFDDIRMRCGFLGKLVLFDGTCYRDIENGEELAFTDDYIVFIVRE